MNLIKEKILSTERGRTKLHFVGKLGFEEAVGLSLKSMNE